VEVEEVVVVVAEVSILGNNRSFHSLEMASSSILHTLQTGETCDGGSTGQHKVEVRPKGIIISTQPIRRHQPPHCDDQKG